MDSGTAMAIETMRPQILERRARLRAAAGAVSAEYLNGLLAEVDAALARMDQGTYGKCETCHDPIEADRLEANPLARFCLDHLSAQEMRAHEADLLLATKIQSKLLPPSRVAAGGWEAHYVYEPAGPVGGDYCELAAVEEGGALYFAVGDVAGKGVAASLLMTHLTAIFRSLLGLPLGMGELMARANRLLCESTIPSHYATLVCGRASGDSVELCSAGHPPALLVQASEVKRLDSPGLPLGLFCSADYALTRAALGAGDLLALYSDGITESRNGKGEEFGEERLAESLRRHRGGDSEAVARGVLEDVKQFRGEARAHDDVTLMVVRRAGW